MYKSFMYNKYDFIFYGNFLGIEPNIRVSDYLIYQSYLSQSNSLCWVGETE